MYTDVERANGLLMDGGIPSGQNNVLWKPPLMNGVLHPCGLNIAWAMIQFRGSGDPKVGIGGRLDRNSWRAFGLTGAGVLSDDTVDAQDTDTSDFPLEIAADNGSGFMVASPYIFNVLDLLIGTASTGTAPVRVLEYSGPAGWVAISSVLVAPVSGAHFTAAETLVWWTAPQDWTPMTVADHGAGVPVGWYGIRVRSTTVPGTIQASATSLSVGIIKTIQSLGGGSVFGLVPGLAPLHIDAPCDALVGVSSIANDSNQFSAQVKMRG